MTMRSSVALQCHILPLAKAALEAAQAEGSCISVHLDDSLLVQPALLVDPLLMTRALTALFCAYCSPPLMRVPSKDAKHEAAALFPHLKATLDAERLTHMRIILAMKEEPSVKQARV
jgi:hypothetical protein